MVGKGVRKNKTLFCLQFVNINIWIEKQINNQKKGYIDLLKYLIYVAVYYS